MKTLQAIRRRMHFTQAQVAERANLPVRDVRRAEQADVMPDELTLRKLARALNLPSAQLPALVEFDQHPRADITLCDLLGCEPCSCRHRRNLPVP